MKKLFKNKSMIYATLATVFSGLVILFTFLSTRQTKKESDLSEAQLKESVNEVSKSLKQSLEKTTKIVDDINSLGDSLSIVKTSISNSLDEAKRFQALVDEQVKIESKRFKLESADILIVSNSVEFVPMVSDSTLYIFRVGYTNYGERSGTIKLYQCLLLLIDENSNILNEVYASENKSKRDVAGRGGNGGIDYPYGIKKDELMNSENRYVVIIKYIYEDESLKKDIEIYKHFGWYGYSINGFKFNELRELNTEKYDSYFNKKFSIE